MGARGTRSSASVCGPSSASPRSRPRSGTRCGAAKRPWRGSRRSTAHASTAPPPSSSTRPVTRASCTRPCSAPTRQARDRRSVFAVPRGEVTYLGTTDTDHGPPTDHPAVPGEDADYLLDAANRTFVGPPLARADVVAAWAGLRPLLHEEGKRPSEISRKDEIMVSDTGLVSIAGGKLTTHRRMAERVVDLVVERLGRTAGACRTASVPLPAGALAPEELPRLVDRVRAGLPQLAPGGAERLVALYGAGAERIVARGRAEPAAGEVLPGGILRAEVAHALDEEMALTLEDLLERRTRLLLFDPGQGLACAAAVADMAAARLGWDRARTAAELEGYRALAASSRGFA